MWEKIGPKLLTESVGYDWLKVPVQTCGTWIGPGWQAKTKDKLWTDLGEDRSQNAIGFHFFITFENLQILIFTDIHGVWGQSPHRLDRKLAWTLPALIWTDPGHSCWHQK